MGAIPVQIRGEPDIGLLSGPSGSGLARHPAKILVNATDPLSRQLRARNRNGSNASTASHAADDVGVGEVETRNRNGSNASTASGGTGGASPSTSAAQRRPRAGDVLMP